MYANNGVNKTEIDLQCKLTIIFHHFKIPPLNEGGILNDNDIWTV